MILNYKYGIIYKGIKYGWRDFEKKELYKLPQTIGKRFYAGGKLKMLDVGKQKGYCLGCDRKSIKQLDAMTIYINFEHQQINDKDTPF